MKFTTNYEVTLKLQEDSVKQYFWQLMLRPHIGTFGLLIFILLTSIAIDFPYKPWFIIFVVTLFFILVAMWVKTYFQCLSQAQAGLKLMEHPRVEVIVDDEKIEYLSSTGSRRHQWDKVSKIEETKDFIILMHGKLPLLSLPKASFTNDIISYMKGKCQKQV